MCIRDSTKGAPASVSKSSRSPNALAQAPQKKDSKYVPPSTKGAESLGSIALRMCFDPDFINYTLKTKQNSNVDRTIPIKSIIPRGIVNMANICFMSSVLQVLLYCKPIIDILNVISTRNMYSRVGVSSSRLLDACVNLYKQFDKETVEAQQKEMEESKSLSTSNPTSAPSSASSSVSSSSMGSLVSASNATPPPQQSKEKTKQLDGQTSATSETGITTSLPAIKPDDFYKILSTIPKFRDLQWGRQEDAEEFLTHLLDQLHEELVSSIDCLTDNEIQNLLQSINDESLKIFIVRNLPRYKKADFITNISPKLKELINKYGAANDDTSSDNEWFEVSGSSKKGKKNKLSLIHI